MDKANRFTFAADTETLTRLDEIKKEYFYDRPWSDVCLHLIKLGIESYNKGK